MPTAWRLPLTTGRESSDEAGLNVAQGKTTLLGPLAGQQGRRRSAGWPGRDHVRLSARTMSHGRVKRSWSDLPGSGSVSRTRTCDRAINSRLLYQLSYHGIAGKGGIAERVARSSA